MRIDSHCHIDLFDDPVATCKAYENAKICCVMATMLPSHFQAALPHLVSFKQVIPALGMHPMRAKEAFYEISLFEKLVNTTNFIGEIGLDMSSDGRKTFHLQLEILKAIFPVIGRGKFITVHSRNAHDELLTLLDDYKICPVCFHYFTGGPEAARRLVAKGHFVSVNYKMMTGLHAEMVCSLPRDRLIIETDGPFLTKNPVAIIDKTYHELGRILNMTNEEIEALVWSNFYKCRTVGSQIS